MTNQHLNNIHLLRNPWGHTDEELRASRLWAASEIERLHATIRTMEAQIRTLAGYGSDDGTPPWMR